MACNVRALVVVVLAIAVTALDIAGLALPTVTSETTFDMGRLPASGQPVAANATPSSPRVIAIRTTQGALLAPFRSCVWVTMEVLCVPSCAVAPVERRNCTSSTSGPSGTCHGGWVAGLRAFGVLAALVAFFGCGSLGLLDMRTSFPVPQFMRKAEMAFVGGALITLHALWFMCFAAVHASPCFRATDMPVWFLQSPADAMDYSPAPGVAVVGAAAALAIAMVTVACVAPGPRGVETADDEDATLKVSLLVPSESASIIATPMVDANGASAAEL